MSRRRPAEIRKILPDPRFNDLLIAKFCNVLMEDGKKSVARKILYRAMEEIGAREKEFPPLEIVKSAVDHVKPTVEVKSRRVGGSTYQVPVEVRHQRRAALAILTAAAVVSAPTWTMDLALPADWSAETWAIRTTSSSVSRTLSPVPPAIQKPSAPALMPYSMSCRYAASLNSPLES